MYYIDFRRKETAIPETKNPANKNVNKRRKQKVTWRIG